MAKKEVLRMGHPLLRKQCKPLSIEEIKSEETLQLIEDLKETMNAYEGIGIAAPQIGVNKQLAIVGIPDESERYPDAEPSQSFVVINPLIKILDNEQQGFWEGCLSVPGLRGFVERPRKIQLDFLDENAKEQSLVIEDFLATVFQHELDHLDGILYVDRITDTTKLSYNEEFDKYWVQADQEEEAEGPLGK